MKELADFTTDICQVCYNKVEVIEEIYCRHCGKRREVEDDLCLDCLTHKHEFEAGRSVFVYDEQVKKSLFGIKFYHHTWIARKMGRIMANYYLEQVGWDVDYLIPVPIHYFKQITRGYDQSELLAKYFIQEYNEQMIKYNGKKIQFLQQGLKRVKWTKPQKDLDPERRYINLENAFEVNKKIRMQIKNKNILIIDDIYTTGATMDACAKILKAAHAGKVFYITAAIGNGL